MAVEVIREIKAAEEKAQETRRAAAVTARDSVKLAQQENDDYKNKELSTAKRNAKAEVEKAEAEARAALETQNKQRLKECDDLKSRAAANLSRAAEKCLERIIK